MTDSEAFRARANWAFRRVQDGAFPAKVKHEDLAERVGKRIKREFSQPTGSRWLGGSVPRDLETMEALADELGVDPGWLYFNRGVAPVGWEEALRRFPPANTPEKRLTKSARKTRRRAAGE